MSVDYKNPYIKVTWEDTPENFTAEKIRRVKSYFQHKYNTKNVSIVTKTIGNTEETKLKSLDISESITDTNYQKTLMKDFIKENEIEVNWERLDKLDNAVNEEYIRDNGKTIRYNKWELKSVEFSNFLSYGQDNTIDFTNLNGITVVESTPKNFGGKSTATVDLLMFLFFNKTTKTKTNSEIYNRFTDKDEVYVKGVISIDNDNYVIERISRRKKSRSGDYTVTNSLEFYKELPDGTVENLTGEQRRETEEYIISAIGSEEDFLSTILTTGYNLEELIESKPTARGQILTKFMGLETFRDKEDICKEMLSNWSKKLVSNTYNIVDLQVDITNLEKNISDSEELIKEQRSKRIQTETKLKELEVSRDNMLSKRNNDIDQELIKLNPIQLGGELSELATQKAKMVKDCNEIVVKEPSNYYIEEDHESIKERVNDVILEGRMFANDITAKEKLIEQLEKGSICPTCNRALDEVDHTPEIEKIRKEIEDLIKKKGEVELKYKTLSEEEKKFSVLKSEYDLYERNKLLKIRAELEIEQKDNQIQKIQEKIDNYAKNKQKLDDNRIIDSDLVGIRTQIETCNADIRVIDGIIERSGVEIENFKVKIGTNNDLIKKIQSENETNVIFKVYLSLFGKNGISKVIMRNMIPLINQELYRLLVDSCNFILELNINDKNEVDFYMIDTETRVVKPLNAGSGFERTISSLALRSVLAKISALPKPNIVVMDEVFGKIADENIEMVGEFFKKIKRYFDHIFVISHNPLIRNWSDNLLMVKKEENVSSIDFITNNIS